MFETLVTIDDSGHLHLGSQLSWSPNNGGYAWEFFLRRGVSFPGWIARLMPLPSVRSFDKLPICRGASRRQR